MKMNRRELSIAVLTLVGVAGAVSAAALANGNLASPATAPSVGVAYMPVAELIRAHRWAVMSIAYSADRICLSVPLAGINLPVSDSAPC